MTCTALGYLHIYSKYIEIYRNQRGGRAHFSGDLTMAVLTHDFTMAVVTYDLPMAVVTYDLTMTVVAYDLTTVHEDFG